MLTNPEQLRQWIGAPEMQLLIISSWLVVGLITIIGIAFVILVIELLFQCPR